MIKRSLALIALLAAGIFVPAAGAHAQTPPQGPDAGLIGIRLLEAPVNRDNDPRARIYIVDHLAQATTITRKIEVSNTTKQPQGVVLYAGGATLHDGAFVGALGRGENELTGWPSANPPQLTVPPGGRAQA